MQLFSRVNDAVQRTKRASGYAIKRRPNKNEKEIKICTHHRSPSTSADWVRCSSVRRTREAAADVAAAFPCPEQAANWTGHYRPTPPLCNQQWCRAYRWPRIRSAPYDWAPNTIRCRSSWSFWVRGKLAHRANAVSTRMFGSLDVFLWVWRFFCRFFFPEVFTVSNRKTFLTLLKRNSA